MPDVTRLIFDERGEEHIARHSVTEEEVRQACESGPLVRRERRRRLVVYGHTDAGRYMIVVLAPPVGGAFYVLTAREMSRTERRRYTRFARR